MSCRRPHPDVGYSLAVGRTVSALGVTFVIGLTACADLPELRPRDGGLAGQADAGPRHTDVGAVQVDVGIDAGPPHGEPVCARPTASGVRFREMGNALVLDEASLTPLGDQLTFEAWARFPPPRALGVSGGPVFGRQDEADGGLFLSVRFDGSAVLCVHRYNNASVATRICMAEVLPLDEWLHLALVIDGASATLWVNGAEVARGDLGAPLDPVAAPVYGTIVGAGWQPSLMRYQATGLFDIDEFALHREVRYAAPFTPPASLTANATTAGLYRLDERGGATAADASGNAQPATLLASAWLDGCERAAYFGDGADGAVVVRGSVTLTRDMDYEALRVDPLGEINTGGHRVRVRGTATIDGTLRDDGASGSVGGRVLLQASHITGAGALAARGGDGLAPGQAGAAGGEVRVITEDAALPATLTVSVEGGAPSGDGAQGSPGSLEVLSVVVP